jgi:amino acid adenylation domain-containing protein
VSARNIETIYKLSSLQEGMLFHSILEPGSEVYLVQFSAKIRGRLDVAALREAWRRVIERHGMLRASFHWKEVEKPVQIIHGRVELPWNELDWRGMPDDEQSERVGAFLQDDLRQGFALNRPPLTRLTLIRLEDDLHQFVVTQHHLILDGWSLHVILREVFMLFRASSDGRPPTLPPSRPFGDYLMWLRRQDIGEARAFWAWLLRDLEAPTPVPLAVASEIDGVAETEYWDLGSDLTLLIQEFARTRELTVNTVVQGAWALMLGRLTGEDDLVYGSVVAGRPPEIAGIDTMVGMFINTLPVRVQLVPEKPVEEWLREFQALLAAIRRFEFSPLVDVQSVSSVPRATPLFHSIVAFENYPTTGSIAQAVPGLEIFDTRVAERTNYPITFSVIPGDSLQFKLVYDSHRLNADSIRRIFRTIEQLLREILANADAPLSELSGMTEPERHRVLYEWNSTERHYAMPSSVHELFEEQAARTPDRPAAYFHDRQISFRELNARANQLAHHLRARGVGPESIVGVCLDRSIDAVVALLGILKAGGAYLPLDPAYPGERLEFMCGDAGLEIILTEAAHRNALPAGTARRLLIDREWEEIARESTDNLAHATTDQNAAYVIYTSGSTGQPKGVVGLHGGAVNRFRWMWETYPFDRDEIHAQKTSLNFLDSLWEIFGPLLQGVPIVIFDNDTVKDPRKLVQELERTRVTRLVLVPSLLRVLLESERPAAAPHPPFGHLLPASGEKDARRRALNAREGLLPELKICVTSGEELPVSLWRRFTELLPNCLLLDLYGSSEISADATYEELREADPSKQIVPIGRPMANMRAYVLDHALEPVPVGVQGELYIAGVGLARGYLRRPSLTAERFIPDPFSSEPGARLFRTGDLARWSFDGRLEYLGRSDHQVKIRGFRVELGEIEAVLLRHPAVASCVVVAREGEAEDRRLVAYVMPRTGDVSSAALRQHVASTLPDFMVPSAFVVLDTLPLTPSGKIDRRALPAPDRPAALKYIAPRSVTEAQVAEVFGSLLGLERVGAEDDFFELGGHSLMATQVVSRIRDRYGLEFPVGMLFQASTVASLAHNIDEALAATATDSAVVVHTSPEERPLSFAQQRLWFLDQLVPGDPLYNVPVALRIKGPLDAPALEQSFCEIVRRHHVLRTRLVSLDGRPEAVLSQDTNIPLEVIDAEESRIEALVREEALRSFDLARDTLLRVKLFRLGAQDHVLMVTLHHIASDGWSIGVLIREVASLYEAFSQGRASPLPEVTFQYADYAQWQREWLQGERLDEQVAWWKRQLEGMPPLLELPTDRPRPPAQSYRGRTERFSIAPELIARLLEVARQERTTPFMTLLAALQTLLHRYSRQERIGVGTPIAGRTRSEIEPLIGFFVNTLVMPSDFSGDPSFRELLGRVRETALGAYAHQDLPFEKLVEELRPERDLGRHPLFQVMFVLQNEPMPAVQPRGLQFTPVQVDTGLAKFDLLLQIVPQSGAWQGSIEYSTDLFDRATIQRLIGHYQTLLTAVADAPSGRVSELPMLPEGERRTLLFDWNSSRRDYDQSVPLHRIVERQAEETPDAVAVSFEGASLRYADLNRRANQLAHFLRRQGVGPEIRVGVSMERSLDLVIALLAVLKAGGAYVPIDPDYPRERVDFMIEDSRVRHLLTSLDWNSLAHEPTENLSVDIAPENLAYVIYTSGSTGRPKGAMNTHRGIVNRLRWMQETFRLGSGDVVAQKTPFSFDVSVWEFFWPLMTGARLAVARPGGHRDGRYLVDRIEREGVTVIHFVPAMLQAFLREPDVERCRSLRLVVCSGEALSLPLQEQFFRRMSAELHNLYGPTEAAVDVTHWRCRRGEGEAIVPIGRPIANTQIYILDRHLEPVPIGIPGELFLGGTNVGRGYLRRPSLTAEKFLPDPFGEERGRLYRTGDLARWLSDGSIEFLGRLDDQIKLRGFRIELGEIESVLSEQPGIRQAVVVARDAGEESRLVAYVVPSTGATPNITELKEALRRRLPEYMIPAAFVFLESLPLNPSGKVDRRALPEAGQARVERADFTPPRSSTEQGLAAIWAELLNVGTVGLRDDFFALGGHSLLATRLTARVRETFSVELPLRSIFIGPTLKAMAAAIDGGERHEQIALSRIDRNGELPLSFIQERLWFLDQFEPGSTSLNIPLVVRIRGRLDEAALERSLEELVCRHESLRTTFASVDGMPRQFIRSSFPLSPGRLDLRPLAPSEREKLVQQEIEREAATPFDLASGPLIRVRLLTLEDQESILLVTVHHIVADGWSLAVLLRELDQLYTPFRRNEPDPLSPLSVQYVDFAHWQRACLQGEQLDRQLTYWKKTLSGAPRQLDLPLDYARPPVQTYRGARVRAELDVPLAEKLRALSQRSGATLFMTLLAAFEVILGRWSNQDDVVVGAPVATRPSRQLENVVGPFLNTVALRTDLSGDPSFAELLERVRETVVGGLQHQDVPFEKVLEAVNPERDLSRTPLFQVFFNMLNFQFAASRLGDLRVELLSTPDPESKFDLTMYISEQETALRLDLVYNSDLFVAARMEELLRQLTLVLRQVAESPHKKILELSLVTDKERAVLPDPAAPLEDTWRGAVHEVFSSHARRTPDRDAVVERNGRWSYSELEAISNRLAHHLIATIENGPEPWVVAIYGHRSAPLVAAVLAVLKSGAAFAMLDPAYPPRRNLEHIRAISPAALVQIEEAGALPPELERELPRDLVRISIPPINVIPPWVNLPADPPAINVEPNDLACITFTSGSTGTPKAVAGLHRSLTHFTPWQCERFGLAAEDRFSMFSGLAHDPLQRDVFTPLQIGGSICIPDPDRLGEPAYLQEWAAQSGVTVMHLTPAMIQLFVESASASVTLSTLRRAFIVGDALTRSDVARLKAIAPNMAPVNFYGSTETQRAVGYYDIDAHELQDSRRKSVLPLGRGIPGVQLLVLNRARRLAGVGEVGEVNVRSPHLAGGYLNDPGLTRDRFVRNPFTDRIEDRLYRTGDLGRYLPDGNVEWFGRADRQVKIRGFRVELGEVEAAIERHPAVQEAVVTSFGEDAASRHLVAYLVPRQGEEVTSETVRRFLAVEIPESMIPRAFVFLDKIPLTPNRKVDRSALPQPDLSEQTPGYVMPRDVVEIELARIWEEVLGRRPVGIRDDFFALGGHSLLAVRLLSRIEQHFGRKLPLVTFFQHSTVEQLAAELRRAEERRRRSPLVAIQPAGSRHPFFCVHPVGGTVLCYRGLAAKLRDDQPLFALEAVGVNGDRLPIRSIEQMAREYLTAVRQQQPKGPYHLGGWSFGGIVAFEMAQQLRAAGEQAGVILLDTWTPGSLGDFEDAGDDATILRLLARALGDIAGRPFDLATDTLRQQGGRDQQLAHVVSEAHRMQALPPDVGVAQLRPLFAVVEANLEARRNYHPQRYSGRLVLMKAAEALLDAPGDETLGWHRFAEQGVEVHVVPGNHHTMLGEPNVDVLVGYLRPYLEQPLVVSH